MNQKASILLVYTGGTIGMRTDPDSGALMPFDFNDIYEEFPNLRYLDAGIEVISFKPIDSSNVKPELWIRLAEMIRDNYSRFDGFVVLHGTDTMSYTASALSFMLENLDKPVVFTGSQIPIGVMRTDGRENLITAIEIAAARIDGRAAVPEVCLYFQNKLFRANRTKKYSAEELNAFRSDNFPALAHVGVNIHYNVPYISRPQSVTSGLEISTNMDPDVLIVKIFPGMTERALSAILSIEGTKAVVLETYGSGNAPTEGWFLDIIRETIGKGIIIVNVSQCSSGSVDMELYDTGIRLQEMGVVSGRDMTTEAAVTKLMYLLGKGLDAAGITSELKRSVRGEISL